MLDREVLDRRCEQGILGLVLAILVFTPLAFGGRPQPPAGIFLDFLLVDPFQFAQWLTLLVLVLWGIRLWLNPRPQLLWPPICWAVLAFTLYAIARYLTADIEYAARQELLRVLVYSALFFAVLNNLHRQESIQIITFTLFFLAMAISMYAIFQLVKGSQRVWYLYTSYKDRASGTYICPNHLGGFLELLVPLGLAYTVAGRVNPVLRVFVGYATLVMAAGIVVTVSRGTWLATALALIVFFGILLFRRTYRLPALACIVVMIVLGVLFTPRNYGFQARYRKLVVEQRLDDDARFFLWEPALKLWQANPLWGVGPAHFDYRFRQFRPEIVQLSPDRAHNDFLNLLADWGAVGAAIVCSAFLLLGIGAVKTWRMVGGGGAQLGGKRTSNKLALVLGATIGLLALLLHSMVDFNWYIPANAMIAITLMALLSSHLRFATDRYWFSARLWSKALASLLFVAALAYIGPQVVRHAQESYWLARVQRLPGDFSPQHVALLQKAFSVEPKNPDTTFHIGQAYWAQSKEGGENYKELAAQAMDWFQRGTKLNPWDGDNYLGYGQCLDWVGRDSESGPYFDKAEQLDPNSYFTIANIGLHYVQLRDFAAAKQWFQRSLRLEWRDNPIAVDYLQIASTRLAENATNEISARLNLVAPQK